MKKTLCALAALCLSSGVALAKDVFLGYGRITAATSQCAGSNYAEEGKVYNVLLRPTHLNPSNPDSWLVFHDGNGEIMISMRVSVGSVSSGALYTANSILIDGPASFWAGTFTGVSASASAVPATVKTITISGNITSFLGIPDCTVTFLAPLVKKTGF